MPHGGNVDWHVKKKSEIITSFFQQRKTYNIYNMYLDNYLMSEQYWKKVQTISDLDQDCLLICQSFMYCTTCLFFVPVANSGTYDILMWSDYLDLVSNQFSTFAGCF